MTQPRYKRYNRKQRLVHAKNWIKQYTGKKLYHGYAKHYGISKLGAVIELEMLGEVFPPDLKEKLRNSEIARINQKKERKKVEDPIIESDEYFAFIVGYTPGGAPYGVTWEEMEGYPEYEQKGLDLDEDEDDQLRKQILNKLGSSI